MTNRSIPHNGLFLIELIISIFFFIISCTVAVQLFVKSYNVSQNAISYNNAALYTQNIAEIFLSSNDNFNAVKAMYSDTKYFSDDFCILLLFDKNWDYTVKEENAFFAVYAKNYSNDDFSYIDIYIYEYQKLYTNDYIHKQTIKKYLRSAPIIAQSNIQSKGTTPQP